MPAKIPGLHHITAISGQPQRNLDFYTGVLGLRLVKLTVNFDDPGTYHLYFGDAAGRPGTILTFFPFPGAAPGQPGVGQAVEVTFGVPAAALPYWERRLAERGVPASRVTRLGEPVLTFADPDGLPLGLAALPGTSPVEAGGWAGDSVATPEAIAGFHSTTLLVRDAAPTTEVLTGVLGLAEVGRDGARTRYATAAEGPGAWIDVVAAPAGVARGTMSAGTIHHVAWRTPDDESQAAWQQVLGRRGFSVTPVQDRQYFHSIYFREPGGVLYEVATDPPGFATDEALAALGSSLMLPPWLEPRRSAIERALPPLRLPAQRSRV